MQAEAQRDSTATGESRIEARMPFSALESNGTARLKAGCMGYFAFTMPTPGR
jgi:hypothetical protein